MTTTPTAPTITEAGAPTVPTYRVRAAMEADLPAVIGLRRYAEAWLRDAGINQWTSASTGDRVIREHFDAGTTYVVEQLADASDLEHQDSAAGGKVVGAFSIGEGDPDFWTEGERRQPAVYLYKFTLGPEARGTGLGDVVLDWVCAEAEQRWALWVRLDCNRDNTGLHRYYEDRAFFHRETRSAPGRASGALFERLAERQTVTNPRVVLIDATGREPVVFAAPTPAAQQTAGHVPSEVWQQPPTTARTTTTPQTPTAPAAQVGTTRPAKRPSGRQPHGWSRS